MRGLTIDRKIFVKEAFPFFSLQSSYYVPCLKPGAFPYAETVFAIARFSSSDSLAPLFLEIGISTQRA